MSFTKKTVAVMSFLFFVVLGTVYLLGMAFFQTHLKMGTDINGFHCSFKSVDEASALLLREADSYALAVLTRNGGVEEISAEDVGLTFVGNQEIANIINNQNYVFWFIPENESVTLSSECYQIDEDRAKKSISKLKCMNDLVEGKTAEIVNTNGTYQVSPGVRGTNLDKDMATQLIEDAVLGWKESVDLEAEGCYVDVEQADEEALQEQCDFLNSIQDTVITYDFSDRKETVTMETIEKQLLDENFMLTTDSVRSYVKSLANKYNTVSRKRNFKTFDDRTVEIEGGDYGWKIDIDRTSQELVDMISANTVNVAEPVYLQTAVSRGRNDIGYSYLEINSLTGAVVLYANGMPIVQTTATAGSNVRPGFWKIRGREETTNGGRENAVFFDETCFVCRDPIVALTGQGTPPDDAVLISDEHAMETIYANIQDDWPIIICDK